MNLLSLEQAQKSYGEKVLLKQANFYLNEGEKVGIIGINGTGKTTLLRSLLGLIKSLSGSVEQGENLEIGYFEQEVKGENRTTCIEELWQEFRHFPSMKCVPHWQNVA